MKRLLIVILITTFSFGFFSCNSTAAVHKKEKEQVTYTLKNKKELMNQKISNKKCKTIIASL